MARAASHSARSGALSGSRVLDPHTGPEQPRARGLERCPVCEGETAAVFHRQLSVPVHSVLLHRTRSEAVNYPRGDIALACCPDCSHVYNAAFEARRLEYSERCEETQGCSPTFRAFADHLARRLVADRELSGKTILEIGCGKGEFLVSLCDLGGNRGFGFDPAYVPGRLGKVPPGVTFIPDLYSAQYAHLRGDFICCRMTLEHIAKPFELFRLFSAALNAGSGSAVFVQVPNGERVIAEAAFWDVYYEHCAYFSQASLEALFERAGLTVRAFWKDYEDQYLFIEGEPRAQGRANVHKGSAGQEMLEAVRAFSAQVGSRLAVWNQYLNELATRSVRTVVWGGGSKAVSFLTAVDRPQSVEYVVDINPKKHGTYLAGTGHAVIPPALLRDYRPEAVIVMNAVYVPEIRAALSELGLAPSIVALDDARATGPLV
jgi:hypothetical protein